MELKRRYVLGEDKRIAVQLDINTFEALERVLEDYGFAKLFEEDDGETLSLDEAKRYYDALPKTSSLNLLVSGR